MSLLKKAYKVFLLFFILSNVCYAEKVKITKPGQGYFDNRYVNETGDTMTGALTTTGLTISGLTQQSILFAGSGGLISQDNSNFIWDDVTNTLILGGTPLGAKETLSVQRTSAETEEDNFAIEAKNTQSVGNTGTVRSLRFNTTYSGTGTAASLVGVGGSVAITGNGTATEIVGQDSGISILPPVTPTVTTAYNIRSGLAALGNSTTTELISYGITIPTIGTGTLQRWYGLKIPAHTVGTTQWGINSAEDVQVNSDVKLILEGDGETKGDTYLTYDSAGTTLDMFVNGTEICNASTTVVPAQYNILKNTNITGDLDVSGGAGFGSAGATSSTELVDIDNVWTATSGTNYNLRSLMEAEPAATSTAHYRSILGWSRLDTAQTLSTGVVGVMGQATIPTGVAATMTGLTSSNGLIGGYFSANAGDATVAYAAGVFFDIPNTNDGVITNAVGLRMGSPTVSGTGSITNLYGIFFPTLTSGTSRNADIYHSGTTPGIMLANTAVLTWKDFGSNTLMTLTDAGATGTLDVTGIVTLNSITGNTAIKGSLTLGRAAAGVDYTIAIDGETNDFLATWDEDADGLIVSDDILMQSTEALAFRDTAIYINSIDDGHLDLTADVSVDVNGSLFVTGVSTLEGIRAAVLSKSTDYTLTATDVSVFVDASGGDVTITLPTAVGASGQIYIIKRTDNTPANVVGLDGNGAETIDGVATQYLTAQYDYMIVQSDNSNWMIIG